MNKFNIIQYNYLIKQLKNMRIIKYIILMPITLVILSNCQKNEDYVGKEDIDVRLTSFIDTMKYMNSLFNSKYILLKPSDNIILDMIVRSTADLNDNIYLLGIRGEIYKFNINGEMISSFKNLGKGPGEYLGVNYFFVDSNENLFIDDIGSQNILIYDKNFKFIKSLKKPSFANIRKMIIKDSSTLICFNPLGIDNSIYQYDLTTGLLNKQYGNIDRLALEYKDFIRTGGIDIFHHAIYYALPHIYKVYKVFNGIEEIVINGGSNYFKELNYKIENPLYKEKPYSSIENIFVESKIIFITTFIDNKVERKKSKNEQFMPCDIFTIYGRKLRERVYFNKLTNLNKYGDKKYISLVSPGSKSFYNENPIVVMLEYKF